MNYKDLSNNSIGLIFKNNDKFKPNSDYFLIDFTRKKLMTPNSIVHYYAWDRDFHTINTKIKYIKHLQKLKANGIKIVCQTDFSAWYWEYSERKAAIKKNFEYLEIANKLGFELILNFNNIFADDVDNWKEQIKDAKTCIFDFNHKESKYAELEFNALRKLLSIAKINLFLVKTNKRSIPKEYNAFFSLLRESNIRIEFLPTEMSILEIRKKKYYNENSK